MKRKINFFVLDKRFWSFTNLFVFLIHTFEQTWYQQIQEEYIYI